MESVVAKAVESRDARLLIAARGRAIGGFLTVNCEKGRMTAWERRSTFQRF
jgi:hypothetical protein